MLVEVLLSSQLQLLLRAVHLSAEFAGGNLYGLSQRNLLGLHKKLRKEKLLILDEWLLYPFKEAEAWDALELVEAWNKGAFHHLLFSV